MNAHVKTSDPSTAKQMRCIPQGHSHVSELANIRELLRLGRHGEALVRLEIALDGEYPSWRGAGA